MSNKNTEKILLDIFDAQQTNFINHLQSQEQNLKAHFMILDNSFSDKSNKDSNQF